MPEVHRFDFEVLAPEEQPDHCSEVIPGSCSACERLLAVEQRVRDATKALKQALAERQIVQQHGNSRHDLFSFLPTEIASHIFSFCIPPLPTLDEFYDDYRWHQEPRKPYMQITLGAVCQGWRQLSWSTPSLWNFLSFTLTRWTQRSCAVFVREWLERSKPLPLTIRLAYNTDLLETINPYVLASLMLPLIKIINESVDRWSSVYFRIPSSYVSELKWDPTHPPAIKALTLWSLADQSPPSRSSRHERDTILPSPSHVRIPTYNMNNIHIQWANISRLEVAYLTVDESMEIFRQSARIMQCKMAIVPKRRFITYAATSVILEHLTILRLSGPHEPLIDQLSCPALRAVSWSINGLELPGRASDFITRSKCTLEEARFTGELHDEVGFIEFLACLPSLKALAIERSIVRGIMDRIRRTAYDQSASFLPNLQLFRYVGPRNFPWSLIPAMVPSPPSSSTNITPRPLKRLDFCIDFSGPFGGVGDITPPELVLMHKIDKAVIEKLLDLQEAGISVAICDKDETQVIDLWANRYNLYADVDS